MLINRLLSLFKWQFRSLIRMNLNKVYIIVDQQPITAFQSLAEACRFAGIDYKRALQGLKVGDFVTGRRKLTIYKLVFNKIKGRGHDFSQTPI